MNLVSFFRTVAAKWTEDERCGFCWVASAPLSIDAMNRYVIREGDECCAHIFLTRYSQTTTTTRNPNTRLINGARCVHNFDLHIVLQRESFGDMIDNEQPGYDRDTDGVIAEVLDKLEPCIGCGAEFDLCELGYDFDITAWTASPAIHLEDNNWTGWRVVGTFEEVIEK